MSIQSPVGTLDIKNATLRVGKLEVSNIQGIDTALNVTRSNAVLIYDDQVSTTTFNGTTSTPGVRDTGNGYLDLAGGYVYWGQKLPNYWVMEFEMDIRSGTNAGSLYANIFSTTNTGGDGYSFTFNDSNDKITFKYDGTTLTETTVSGLFTASEDWQKVVINYERNSIAISLDGTRKFYYKDIERETPYTNGEYVNFSSASTDGRKIRKLKITNGSKWTIAGESNVVYTQGSVGIGVTDPTTTLEVSGTVKATALAATNGTFSGTITSNKDGVVAQFQPVTSGQYTLINFNSKVNSGSDKGFILVQDDSAILPGSSGEDLRMTIGVHNDFRQSAAHSDELWLQGGGRLCYNVGTWDSELNTIIGIPGAGTTGGHEWRVNDSTIMIINHSGNVGIGTATPGAKLDVVGTIKTSSTSTNIVQGTGSAVTVTSLTPVTFATVTITTVGKKVLLMCNGDFQPQNGANDWVFAKFFRGTTEIGTQYTFHPGTAASTNISFAMHMIDQPDAGTHTYYAKAYYGDGASLFGESGLPVIIAIEFL